MLKSEKQLVLRIPEAVMGAMALNVVYKLSAAFVLKTFLVQMYGIFIYICCAYVVWREYTLFFDIHKRKSPLIDTLFLGASSLGMLYLNLSASDLTHALFGVDIFLAGGCSWQVYTMWLNGYFKAVDDPWTCWLAIAEPHYPFRAPVDTAHRDEYRYVLLADGLQVAVFTYLLVFFPSLPRTANGNMLLAILVAGVLGQLLNLFRYEIVLRRTRSCQRADTEDED